MRIPTLLNNWFSAWVNLLRKVLASSAQQEVPLGEEIDFIKAYLDIEQMRLGDRLRVEWDVADDLLGIQVPSLVLQPLVENAIQHGIASSNEPGKLRIHARREDGSLHLQVRDSGPGLPQSGESADLGIGLTNTQARLRTIYGDRHRFELINNDGLTVNMRLPLTQLITRAHSEADQMRLRTLIVDDEPVARHRLKRLLRKDADVAVAAECADGDAAIDAIRKQEFDLVFLDVQMPKTSGFDVVRAIGVERMPAIIFVTAFDRFALQAFEAQALDYLLKPFGEDRVRKALTRAKTFLKGGKDKVLKGQLSGLLNATSNQKANCLLVKDGDRTLVVRPHEIDWVEADADYVRLHVGAASHLIRATLTHMEERLATEGFVRIHRSRLVNLDRIRELRLLFKGESVVVLKSSERLTASQDCLKHLQDRLGATL